jgi:hypothetical protein
LINLACESERMRSSGCSRFALTCELYALANKDFRYLSKTYLARRLKEED